MPRPCTVCQHEDRATIDKRLVAGAAIAALSRETGLSEDALARHQAAHVPLKLVKAAEVEEVAEAGDLLSQVRYLQTRAMGILTKAEASGDLRTALQAIREARANLELLAKLLGQLQQEGTVNVLIAPEWLQVRAHMLTALAPYPEARCALAASLATLEAGNGHG
jgi:hypothetical protein